MREAYEENKTNYISTRMKKAKVEIKYKKGLRGSVIKVTYKKGLRVSVIKVTKIGELGR
jgi:hypothetical protein